MDPTDVVLLGGDTGGVILVRVGVEIWVLVPVVVVVFISLVSVRVPDAVRRSAVVLVLVWVLDTVRVSVSVSVLVVCSVEHLALAAVCVLNVSIASWCMPASPWKTRISSSSVVPCTATSTIAYPSSSNFMSSCCFFSVFICSLTPSLFFSKLFFHILKPTGILSF